MRIALVLCLLSGCGSTTPVTRAGPAAGGLWVLAPHPDDEALMASHAIVTALGEGRDVHVVVMTNGDLGCGRDGWLRQRESVAAMEELGLSEDRIRFLGYPDGYLDALGETALPPLERRDRDGSCRRGNTTYGERGEGARDVHSARTGAPGLYLARNAIEDLASLLERDRPADVYVSHPIDAHPDHATAYVLLRRALEASRLETLPVVHRALVHAGPCWPNGSGTSEPCPEPHAAIGTPYPPLPPPIEAYTPSERVPVPDRGARALVAIARYGSQLQIDAGHDWLGTFARADAIYFRETLSREGRRVVRASDHARTIDPLAPGAELGLRIEGETALVLAGDRTIGRVHLPDGAGESWELRASRRDDEGGVTEIEVRRDGALVAVLVDAPSVASSTSERMR